MQADTGLGAAFPSILARVEIIDVSTTEVSPIEQAITETLAKTSDLESLYRRFLFSSQDTARQAEAGSLATNVLSMHINTCVDTGYNTGVPLYRRAFFDTAFITANPERLEAVERLRVLIDDHVRASKKSCISFDGILLILDVQLHAA